MKKYLIYIIVGFVLGLSWGFYKTRSMSESYESKITTFKENQALRDIVITTMDSAIFELQVERTLLITKSDSVISVLDSAFIEMEKLTNPQVTEATIIEGRSWIEQYNHSLGE